MEQIIQDAMNETVLASAAQHYGVHASDITHVGGFENFIYEFQKDNKPYILRFVHSAHRSFEMVYGELEFIDYLDHHQANVSTVIPTKNNELLVKIPCSEDHYFSVCVFTKAPGTYIKKEDLTDEFIQMFGQAVGKLHALTKQYRPNHQRYHWLEEDYIGIGKRNLPPEYMFVVDKVEELTNKIQSLPRNSDGYGLLHTDLHFGNMYYDQHNITFFDFDDSSYQYFISDIAIIIFYQFMLSPLEESVVEDQAHHFLSQFMIGYNKENKLDDLWFEHLNDFLKMRELILIMVLYGAGEEVINGNFGKKYLEKFIPRAKNDIPFFDQSRVYNR